MTRKTYQIPFAGRIFRRNTKRTYTHLVLKRPRTFADGWVAHAWLDDAAKAAAMARKLERHAWTVVVLDITEEMTQ
jgi:hypothetical protein